MNNSEVAHRWANQTHKSGKGSNFFFEGNVIYSYGYHFPIAQIYRTKSEKDVILVNSRVYSSTTGKHIRFTIGAIDDTKYDTIYVISPKEVTKGNALPYKYTHRDNIEDMVDNLVNLLGLQRRALKRDYTRNLTKTLNSLVLYLETFKCRSTAKEMLLKRYEWTDEGKTILAEVLNSTDTLTLKFDELAKASEDKRKAQEKRKLDKDKSFVTEWKEGLHAIDSLYNKTYGKSDLLRLRNNKVETSKGIVIEKDVALQVYNVVEKVIQKGVNVTFKGDLKVGLYKVDSISKEGTIRAGCHLIKASEVLRVGKQLS